jgi:hypothetical protein
MDNTRPTQPGTVYSTPEAGPLNPPSVPDHFGRTASSGQPAAEGLSTPEATVTRASAGSGPGEEQPQDERTPEEAAQELGDRLKPVLEAAEDVATKALDVTARGLGRLVDKLEERRRHRDSSDSSDTL